MTRVDLSAALADYVGRVVSAFAIPGLAIGIVRSSGTLYEGGFGCKEYGGHEAVDARTIFCIGSTTKAFTAAAVQLLAERGSLALDERVEDCLPEFKLADPYVTREVTVRDLLSHRSGLGAHAGDLLFIPRSSLSRREIVRRLRHVPLAHGLRERFAYNNAGYVVVGEVLAEVAERAWEEIIGADILASLGMSDSNCLHSGFLEAANKALPHWRNELTDDVVRVVPVEALDVDNHAAAGGINSNVVDMERWLRMLLRKGVGDSGRLLSGGAVEELWTPQIYSPQARHAAGDAAEAGQAAAGLGWRIHSYHRHRIVAHAGNLYGYTSLAALVPDSDFGFVLMCNADYGFDALLAIHYWLLDRFLGLPGADWLTAIAEARRTRVQQARNTYAAVAQGRPAGESGAADLRRYAGEYRDRWFGRASVSCEDGALTLTMHDRPGMWSKLRPWRDHTFLARWHDPLVEEAYMSFALEPSGLPRDFRLAATSPMADGSFDYGDLVFVPAQGI